MENKKRARKALVENSTLTAAAQQAGITPRTMLIYLDDEDFAKEYHRQLQAQAIERAEQLAAARANAIMVVQTLMNDETQPGTVRLQAAKTILAEGKAAQDQVDGISRSMLFEPKWQ